jgi:hypothetical protein
MPRILPLITLLICLPLSQAFSQQMPVNHDLHLQTGVYSLDEGYSGSAFSPSPTELSSGRYYRVLQFQEIPLQSEKEAFQAEGLLFLEYLPNFAYLVSIPANYIPSALLSARLRTVKPVRSEWKMSLPVLMKDVPSWADAGSGYAFVNVRFQEDQPFASSVNYLESMGCELVAEFAFAQFAQVRLSLATIDLIAALPYVNFIEFIQEEGQPENYSGGTQHRSNSINSPHSLGRHYDGSGIHVMLQDDGILGPHIDYQGRIEHFITSNSGNHGDHTGGTIMSAGNKDPKGKGAAPGANLYVYGASPNYPGFSAIPTVYSGDTIRITSTSYSDGCNAGYTAMTQTLDAQIRNYPNLIHVFSAGNNGTSNCSYGAGAGWGNITGGHKMGKNVVAVANLTELDVVASSSSRGPGNDGRIKPELAAKGTNVFSTIDPHSYASFTGTSMACPGTAGLFAQLYHAFRTLNNNNYPEGGLVKALAMNTADDLGNPGPDFIYGFGRIHGLRAVRAIENNWYLTDSTAQAQSDTFSLQVPVNTAQLRVMLYWSDYQAALSASKALVNNLDLKLLLDTAVFRPLVLNHTPNVASLSSPAQPGYDSLNNVEQVVLNAPVPGTYQVVVNGTNIPQGPQRYYIVYYFVNDEVELTYPNGAESWVPGENEVLRWDASAGTGTFNIDYSSDGGQTYTPVTAGLSATARHYTMAVPSTVGSQAKVSVSRGSQSDASDNSFTVIGVPSNIQVNWACVDSVGLSWTAVSGADYYVIHRLGTKYMDSVAWSPTNSGVVTNINPFQTDWFSVSARTSGGGAGRRAVAIEKPLGIFACPSLIDAQLFGIVSPSYEKIYDCQNLTSVPLKLEVRNNGVNPLSNIPIKVSVDNGAVQTYVLNGPLNGSTSTFFQPVTGLNLSGVGTRSIKAWVDLAADGWRNNDTMVSIVNVISGTPRSIPWVEDFENFNLCGVDPTCMAQVCAVVDGFINQQNNASDDIDWITDNGGTYTSNTGPPADHTSGAASGKYLYTEASADCNNMRAHLVTPCIDLTQAQLPRLSFWYHMYGGNMGELHVDIMIDGVWQLDITPAWSGNQGNLWKQGVVDLQPYNGKMVNFRFRGITGNGYMSDLAIDDIMVTEHVGIDNELVAVFRVFPNPVSDYLQVTVVQGNDEASVLELYDSRGAMVLSVDAGVMLKGASVKLDVSNLAAGVYSLKVLSGNRQMVSRVVKLTTE